MSAPAYYEWRLGAALLLAQLQATLARQDIGTTGNACVRLYTTTRPEEMGASPAPWLEIPLARPAGVIADGRWYCSPKALQALWCSPAACQSGLSWWQPMGRCWPKAA